MGATVNVRHVVEARSAGGAASRYKDGRRRRLALMSHRINVNRQLGKRMELNDG